MLTHALQIIHTHTQLRSSSDAADLLIDEVDMKTRLDIPIHVFLESGSIAVLGVFCIAAILISVILLSN